MIKAAFQQ